MARRQPPSLPRRTSPKRTWPRISSGSGIVGTILLAVAVIWFGWLLLHQLGGPALPTIPIIGFPPIISSDTQIPSLAAEGITLAHTDQTPKLNKQQILLIAGQLQPDAAARSRTIDARYVVVTYANKSTPATHPDLNNTPVWLIHYQKIPLDAPDPAVDPTPLARTSYDLYLFLDANNGKELLMIQV